MKVAIINFSGNVGKTTVAKQLLAPRMNAPEFAVETINADASDDVGEVECLKGREFGSLQDELQQLESAIVDIGASNVEEFIKLMGQFDGSHEEFDYYVVPVVSGKKQQADAVNIIKTLGDLGVPARKIRVAFNKVLSRRTKGFTLRPDAVLFGNEVFERLRPRKKKWQNS